ncbi:3-phosphoserine/phosphohydroxythreonine transaminase [Patescibacteria group bacterium]|nr:3-phosphoserine/phosphohydroxythreonine transaminase [Patescibacteria group bacterium]
MKVWNFNPGPAKLPEPVLLQIQQELLDFQGTGISILETSHRSVAFDKILFGAEENIRQLLKFTSDECQIIFMQGGANMQFFMAPLNLAVPGKPFVYHDTGYWSQKAIAAAKEIGEVWRIKTFENGRFDLDPEYETMQKYLKAAYEHITSNETIDGKRWRYLFDGRFTPPIVVDMSSDFLSRYFRVQQCGLVYAGAQKNLGIAGVTVVIIRNDMLKRNGLHPDKFHCYRTHLGSRYNTPPVVAIYVLKLMTDWILAQGLDNIQDANYQKAKRLYDYIDGSGLYENNVHEDVRSVMNVVFLLKEGYEELVNDLLEHFEDHGLIGLKGHRSVGGFRASLYNAMPIDGVRALVEAMKEFERTH